MYIKLIMKKEHPQQDSLNVSLTQLISMTEWKTSRAPNRGDFVGTYSA